VARPSLAGIAIFVALISLAGCARPTGDFGRAEHDVIHDELMPRAGGLLLGGSSFNLTDQEVEMRDRIWRYLVAPHAYDWFGDIAVEFQRTHIMPMSGKPLKTDVYYGWLKSQRFASSRVRYTRISEDAIADILMMPSAFKSVCAVIEIDRQRGIALGEMSGLEPDVRSNAAARKAENQAAIGWFAHAVSNRYASYSYALDRLLIETPHEEAVDANVALGELAIYADAAERGDFCSDPHGSGGPTAAQVRSRYLHTTPGEGPYRK
jgi:hypothetical protein